MPRLTFDPNGHGHLRTASPKQDAAIYLAHLHQQGYRTLLVVREDVYRVEADGLAPLSFVPLDPPPAR